MSAEPQSETGFVVPLGGGVGDELARLTADPEAQPRVLDGTTADPVHLRELHIQVADAKRNRDEHVYAEKITRARAEIAVIASFGGNPKELGTNAEDRTRMLTIYVAENADYLVARAELAEAEAVLAEREADLAAYLDARKSDGQTAIFALASALATPPSGMYAVLGEALS